MQDPKASQSQVPMDSTRSRPGQTASNRNTSRSIKVLASDRDQDLSASDISGSANQYSRLKTQIATAPPKITQLDFGTRERNRFIQTGQSISGIKTVAMGVFKLGSQKTQKASAYSPNIFSASPPEPYNPEDKLFQANSELEKLEQFESGVNTQKTNQQHDPRNVFSRGGTGSNLVEDSNHYSIDPNAEGESKGPDDDLSSKLHLNWDKKEGGSPELGKPSHFFGLKSQFKNSNILIKEEGDSKLTKQSDPMPQNQLHKKKTITSEDRGYNSDTGANSDSLGKIPTARQKSDRKNSKSSLGSTEQPKPTPIKLPLIQNKKFGSSNRKLTNQFNDLSLLQKIQKSMKTQLMTEVEKIYQQNSVLSNQHYLQKTETYKPTLFHQIVGGEGPTYEQNKSSIEQCSFTQHFDLQRVLSTKCTVCICYKMKDRRFVLKSLPSDIIDLQDLHHQTFGGGPSDPGAKVKLNKYSEIDFMDRWSAIVPQLPHQNFVTCYGIIKVRDQYYVISDLIEDHQVSKVDIETERTEESKPTEESVYMGSDDVNSNAIQSDSDQEQKKEAKVIVQKTNFGNFDLPDSDSINDDSEANSPDKKSRNPIFNTLSLVQDRPSPSRTFVSNLQSMGKSPAKKNTTVSSQGVSSLVSKRAKLTSIGSSSHRNKETYFGERIGMSEVKIAQNMYDMIRLLNLGNLSGLPRIPDFYLRCLLGYIIQISRALAHAHQHDLVHGKLNLSKILVQKQKLKEQDVTILRNMNTRSSLRRQTLMDTNPYRVSSFNFLITNFEPFIVFKLLREYSEQKEDFKVLFAKNKALQLDYHSVLQVVKVKDLQAFANSIIEIMVGRSEQLKDYSHSQDDTASISTMNQETSVISDQGPPSVPQRQLNKSANHNTPLIGKIPLDLIPLNWSKIPETQQIFEILSLCFGPYDTVGGLNVDTVRVFNQVHDIAKRIYTDLFSVEGKGQYLYKEVALTNVHKKRMQSATLTNRAVAKYLNLTEMSSNDERKVTYQQVFGMLEEALKLSPRNAVANLNKLLLKWEIGEIRDDQFQFLLQTEIFQTDPEASRIMYILFKKNIQGGQILDSEMKDAVKIMQGRSTSNLARSLFGHPEFLKYQRRMDTHTYRKIHNQLKFIKNQYYDESKVYQNQRVELDSRFEATGIFFSSNDQYLVVIGQKNLVVIDCRSGSRVYKQNLPKIEEMRASHVEKDSDFDTEGKSTKVEKARGDYRQAQFPTTEDYTATESDLGTPISTMNKLRSFGNTTPLEESRQQNETQSQNQTSLEISPEHSVNIPPAPEAFSDQHQEMQALLAKYPYKWVANLGNNGKQLVLYDKAQQRRNKEATFRKNKQEILMVYTIVLAKASNFEPNIYKLDMLKMLNGQEVLSFGMDDYVNDQFGLICVQAKDLCLYIIDFEKKTVVYKMDQTLTSIQMKSLFFNLQTKDQNLPHYEHVKEYVQQQRLTGNVVKMPKRNEEVVAILEKGTCNILLYHIKKKVIVRRFKLLIDDIFFEADNFFTEDVEDGDSEQEQTEDLFQDQNTDLLGKAMAEEDQLKKTKEQQKGLFKKNLYVNYDKAKENMIKIFDISPKATLIAAQIGSEIFIKVLNQVDRDQWSNSLGYQQSIAFMPLYFDEDYNWRYNKAKVFEAKQNSPRRDSPESSPHSPPEQQLSGRLVETSVKSFSMLKKYSANIMIKNKKLAELEEFVQYFLRSPKSIFNCQLPQKTRLAKIQQSFEVARSYVAEELQTVQTVRLDDLRPFVTFDRFHFERSFEYIKNFECMSTPKSSYLAVTINRSLHLYDYLQNQFLFKIRVSNAGAYNPNEYRRMFFLDNDQLMVIQDGQQRLMFVNIQNNCDQFVKNQTKTKTEDIVLKIDGLKNPDDIDMGFGMRYNEGKLDYQAADALGEKSSEDSDVAGDDQLSISFLDYGTKIKNLCYSRLKADYGYLAIIGEMRFTIYYVYEDDTACCEKDLLFDCQYRFDRQVAPYGQHLLVDFEDSCKHFMTTTSLGYACFWDLQLKKFEVGVFIKLPGTSVTPSSNKKVNTSQTQGEVLSKVLTVEYAKWFVGYSQLTQNLILVDVEESNLDYRVFPQPYEFDKVAKGHVRNMKLDPSKKFLVTSFQNCSITIYDVMSTERLKEIDIMRDAAPIKNPSANYLALETIKTAHSSPNPGVNPPPVNPKKESQVFVDDLCTFAAYLSEDKKAINFKVFDREIYVKKVEKPLLKVFSSSQKQMTTAESDRKLKQEREKIKRLELEKLKLEQESMGPLGRLKQQLLGGGDGGEGQKTCSIF